MKGFFLIAVSLLALPAWAGKFEIVGEGTAGRAADFIRVNIRVLSECHTTALSARQSVDQLTQQALAALEKYKTDIPAQVGVSPEANEQIVKTVYVDNRPVVVCDEAHDWTSSTTIQFKLDNLQLLAQLQDELLRLNGEVISANTPNQARVALSLSKPLPGVLAEAWDAMSDLALQRAHQNALRQVKVLSVGMSNPKVELTKVETTVNAGGQPIYDRVDSEGDTSGISLGSVSLKLVRKFTFKVEAQ
jgi:uncharacterized protein YggE